MLKNYLKLAWRNLAKQKGLSLINIFGLAVGMACFSLFMLYSINEFNFDRFHKNAANIYRVYLWIDAKAGDQAHGESYQPMPLGPAMKRDLPEVENYVRFQEGGNPIFIRVDHQILREKMAFADPQVFTVFSFKLKRGNPETVIQDIQSLVLTEETAGKLFGSGDPIGKTIELKMGNDFVPFRISGIAENLPANSSIGFQMLGNFNYLAHTPSGARRVNNWHAYSYQTFVQLKPGSGLPASRERMANLRRQYYPEEEANSRKDGWTGKGPRIWYGLQPLLAMHTDTKIPDGMTAPVDPKTIWILLAIAAGVLVIASINFTSLAIGRSASRSKEVGIRKVIGGSKTALRVQFLSEAFLLTLISAILALLLVFVLLPYFNRLSGRSLVFSLNQYPELGWLTLGLIGLTGILAGAYPAFVISSFKPVEVLKNKVRLGGSNFFTKSLVVLQFTVSAGLIISTVLILQQLHYMQSRNPGFNKDNLVVVDAEGTDTKRIYPLFRQELLGHPGILGSASADMSLGEGRGWSLSSFQYNGKDKEVYEYFVDPDYLKLMGMQLLAGRNFDPGIRSDTINSVIVNEAMVHEMGWTMATALGQPLKGYDEKLTPVVIGVVKNFNFLSYAELVQPQMFQQFSTYVPYMFFVRIGPGDPTGSLKFLQSSWDKVAKGYPFKYSFLNEDLDRFYNSESRWSNIIGWAGGISIFLACLGLLGLAALTVVNRTKEIGIRKVMGASLSGILGLLSKDFLKWVGIAFLLATPLAWYLMDHWLRNYPYRIHMEWWVFALTGLSMMGITLITVSFHSIKSGLTNPIKNLREE
jgi:putative ABC transport system permease protein